MLSPLMLIENEQLRLALFYLFRKETRGFPIMGLAQ